MNSIFNNSNKRTIFLFALVIFSFYGIPSIAQDKVIIDSRTFGAIEARHIGPAVMSGRINSIDALESDPRLVYVGTASGGLWKSTNGGTLFQPVFDNYFQSIGAVAIDQSFPDTVWVGTGESWTRNSVSIGGGVFKTTDGGKKWKLLGLENTERIARIVIHPKDPDIVFVAALGHLWNSNEERGIYKTSDGGKTWEKVLYIDENTGCSDITIDPDEPDILYAGMWDFRRKPYTFRSGGPGSGLYRTTDCGKTWTRLTKDLPEGTLGRIAVDVSPADPNIVYALIESANTALYKSMDKGESWENVNASGSISERPFYFCYIVADPVDTNLIYKPGLGFNFSENGGKSFQGGGLNVTTSVHSDLHALWISKKDNNFMYLGTDGGVYISNDKGHTWRIMRNLPVSQFYHVSADNKIPYNVYGGLQDNGSWRAPSQKTGGIKNGSWENVGGSDGFYVYPDKNDDNIIFWQAQGGNISKLYKSTNEVKDIKPYRDESTEKLRFNWNTPVIFSRDGSRMYVGAQYLYFSNDKGDTWERISPDLTTDDPEKQKQYESGGVTIDNTSAENHCTIITINESPLDNNVIWAGTDDGNLQVTKDGGKNWTNVVDNVPGLPTNTWCSYVCPGHFDKATAYVSFDGHRSGDKTPYVFKTTDFGETWSNIADDNISSFCHIVIEDLVNPELLFLGTEFGLFLSIDGGKVWSQFTGNIPNVPVRDIVIHPRDNDLILATHGRGILIIDDITPLRHITNDVLNSEMAILPSRPVIITNTGLNLGFGGNDEFVGENPAQSSMITYYLKKRHIFGDMFIEIYNEDDVLINTLPAGKRKGINRVPFNIKKSVPKMAKSSSFSIGALFGPTIPAGKYKIKLVKGDIFEESVIDIIEDPFSPHSDADRAIQTKTVMKAYDMIKNMAFFDSQVLDLEEKVRNISKMEVKKQLKENANGLADKLNELHKQMFGINDRLVGVYGSVITFLGKPTNTQMTRFENVKAEMPEKKTEFKEIIDKDNLIN